MAVEFWNANQEGVQMWMNTFSNITCRCGSRLTYLEMKFTVMIILLHIYVVLYKLEIKRWMFKFWESGAFLRNPIVVSGINGLWKLFGNKATGKESSAWPNCTWCFPHLFQWCCTPKVFCVFYAEISVHKCIGAIRVRTMVHKERGLSFPPSIILQIWKSLRVHQTLLGKLNSQPISTCGFPSEGNNASHRAIMGWKRELEKT